ncbi:transglutaminase family protein isoform X2 [Carex rostrata]
MALISPTLSPSSLALSLSCTAGFRATDCRPFLRSNIQKDWNWRGNGKKSGHGFPSMASQSLSFETIPPCSSNAFLEVAKLARKKLKEEVSLRVKDEDISIAKALLYVAIEDEAILAFNGDEDACSFTEERSSQSTVHLDEVCIGGKSISGWLSEFDALTKEVEAELVQREIGCHVVQVIEAVNTVLFESRHFLRFPVLVDSRFSYLHHVLSSNCGTAIMLSVVYMEICQRLGVSIVGSPLGEDFLIWPRTQTPEELFKVSSGHSLLAVINGGCVEDPRSRASDLNSQSLQGLYVANNRDIIGIALANLIRLHWKRASKGNHGLMLISPLRSINSKDPLLRPVELTLAIMAAERMLLLQPDNWTLRRDYGLLLYYARRYGEAAQELSICMAFAPVEEVAVIEPFVQKLHLLRQIYSLDLEPRHLASS